MERHPMDGMSRAILDNMAQPVFVKDGSGTVIYGNPAYADLMGLPLDQMTGRHDSQIFPPEQASAYDADDRAVLNEGARLAREFRLVTFDGRTIPVLTSKVRLIDAGGSALVLGTITDLSAQAAQAAALNAALDAAREVERSRAAFLANISHGIRTPMNGVLGMLAVLRATPLSPRQIAIAEVIRQSAEHLMRVLGDLISYASLEAGRITLAASPFDPAELVQRIADANADRLLARHLSLATAIAPTGAPVLGDADRLGEVIGRVMDNAIAYTERGGIELSLTREPDRQGREHLRIVIADTGRGLRPPEAANAFDSHNRVNGERADSRSGVGLGLVICRHLMARMGGAITIAARDGGGTVVTLHLVLPQAGERDGGGSSAPAKGNG